jgi:DNA-binding NtrC family response regulator
MILEAERARMAVRERNGGASLPGKSRVMGDLRSQVARFADTPFPVLVHGESGPGKELVGQLLHEVSNRAGEPFLTLNCAAFTAELLEAQLFGHAKGAFTGAESARAGFFEDAGKGTLLLMRLASFRCTSAQVAASVGER